MSKIYFGSDLFFTHCPRELAMEHIKRKKNKRSGSFKRNLKKGIEKGGFILDDRSVHPPPVKLKKCHDCGILILARSKICDVCGAKQ